MTKDLKQKSKTQTIILFLIANFCAEMVVPRAYALDGRSPGFLDAPLIRGPGVSQERIESIADGLGRSTLADYLERRRPGEASEARLRRLVERAQTAWLSESIDSARALFKDITQLTLEADWREPQREAIHYAFLRLAQSSPLTSERDEWLERAVRAFPDQQADASLFPPPLVSAFHSLRTRVMAEAKFYQPRRQFSEARFLLINGKKFALDDDLKIRLPDGTYRVTVLSDLHRPLTETLSRRQLDGFQVTLPALAAGTCGSPSGAELSQAANLSVVYSIDCVRTRSGTSWLPHEIDRNEIAIEPFSESSAFESTLASRTGDAGEPEARAPRRTWLWAGFAALAAGTVYIAYRELNRGAEPALPTVRPVHRE